MFYLDIKYKLTLKTLVDLSQKTTIPEYTIRHARSLVQRRAIVYELLRREHGLYDAVERTTARAYRCSPDCWRKASFTVRRVIVYIIPKRQNRQRQPYDSNRKS